MVEYGKPSVPNPYLLSTYLGTTGGFISPQNYQNYVDKVSRIRNSPTWSEQEGEFMRDFNVHASNIKLRDEGTQAKSHLRMDSVLMPTFDGKTPAAHEWIDKFRSIMEANDWPIASAVLRLPTYLTGSASNWYETEVRPVAGEIKSWDHLHNIFKRNYLSDTHQVDLIAQIESTEQGADEPIQVFVPRYRFLLNRLNPAMPLQEMVLRTRSKLRPQFRGLVAINDYKTFEDFRDACLRIEAASSTVSNMKLMQDILLLLACLCAFVICLLLAPKA